ncbi:MAG: methyltransferase domain-containing protein [Fuerstiella sp.]
MYGETAAAPRLPVYFDRMIDAFHEGATGRHAHLGHWDLQPDGTPVPSQPEDADALDQAQLRLNAEMIRLAHVSDGATILDVACGFGGLVQQLDKSFAELDLTGINIDVRQLEICQRLHSVNDNAMRWQEADACELPFADATFDTVFCIEAMFHFDSRQRFLSEARRVLRPGGRLVLTDVVLVRQAHLPLFCFDAVLNDGYGPWPDPWCDQGDATKLLTTSEAWDDIRQQDATQNTLPSYQFIVPANVRDDRDPGDTAARSAMLLKWLHANHLLRYEYVSAAAKGLA